MKGTVYFFKSLSDAERNQINQFGWSCDVGHKYLNSQEPKKPIDFESFEVAALVEATDAERVWVALQNLENSWADSDNPVVLQVLTNFPRSMSVGDFIVWENGNAERVDRVGFLEIPSPVKGE